jgi:hypothetical protein
MDYRNSEMKIDQLVNYLNDNKINLSPAFQRGHVWKINLRRRLLKNILDKKPIPAVFLYKEASGAKYSYNILDGKQRLESIILFIANSREELGIPKWHEYFLNAGSQRKQESFQIDPKDPKTSFKELTEALIRDFREYSIPTIEISLSEDGSTSLTEIISLFIDINQQGVPVSRFNIVKALCLDSELLKSVFRLIAQKQVRGKDVFYKALDNDIVKVLKRLRDVQAVSDPNYKVDKMWEHLLEICLYRQTRQHRKSIDVIKGFINKKTFAGVTLDRSTIKSVRSAFEVVRRVQRRFTAHSPLFTDYTFLYSVITVLTKPGVLTAKNRDLIEDKLTLLAEALAAKRAKQSPIVRNLVVQTKLHTTDVSKRIEREKMIAEILAAPKQKIHRSTKQALKPAKGAA